MNITLEAINSDDLPQFKADMQEAFRLGAVEGGNFPADVEVLPEADIDRSLQSPGAMAYKAVQNGVMAGGAIIVTDPKKSYGHLDFLYVKHGLQSKGMGKFIWQRIEQLHPEIHVWETCTPYFERRNIHFYVNVCHFHIVAYYNHRHPDPHFPNDVEEPEDTGMFGFRKEL